MFTDKYKIAGKVIEINSIYSQVHDYCRDYLSDGEPDFSVTVSESDIRAEREKSARENEFEGLPVKNYPDYYLEELAVYRKICEKMPDYGTILFHGSVIAVDGAGYLFTAKSGTGKSTHTRLWREYFGDRAVMVNDDKPLISIGEDGVTAHGTPYNGKHRLGTNISVPLRAICILTRAENNSIVQISKAEAYPTLLQQVYRPKNPEQMQKTLKLVDLLAVGTGLYKLGCNMNPDAVEVAYNGMKGRF